MKRAEQLNLERHLITHYLKISGLALGRPNILIVLRGFNGLALVRDLIVKKQF